MANVHARIFLALLFGIFLTATIFILRVLEQPEQTSGSFKLRGKDNNPDAFYLCATGDAVSFGFIYDPHAADDWMFRTAGGSLAKLSQGQISSVERSDGK
jgi:hypothetical protein